MFEHTLAIQQPLILKSSSTLEESEVYLMKEKEQHQYDDYFFKN